MAENKKEIENSRLTMEKMITQRYKPSLWRRFEETIGAIFLGILILICLIGIIYLFITLIENPLSLAILCGTIILIIFWSLR